MNLENINNANATGAVALSTRNRNAAMAFTRCSASAVRLFKNETWKMKSTSFPFSCCKDRNKNHTSY